MANPWPREVRDRALRLYRQHGPTAASQTTGVPLTTIAAWAHKNHYRPADTCQARHGPDPRACGEPVYTGGSCYEHYWRARWPLPLPAHIPAEPRRGWHEQAACRDSHRPDDFYPDSHGDAETPPGHVIAACASCPVRASCLAAAITAIPAQLDRLGSIWGSTPAQRTQLRHTAPGLERTSA